MAISPLPDPPSRGDPSTFAAKGDALMAALPTFVTEANALQTDVNAKQTTASDAATTATTQAGIATTKAGEAATSATSAADSKTQAAQSASDALLSKNAAATSAADAANSAATVNAQGFATDYAGATEPPTKWAYMTWADTAKSVLWRRNLANSEWLFERALFNGTGQLAGTRNKIINGAFAINQRGYVSGAATTVGQYTLDRWKVTGTGGITFATVNGKTTVTIPAGQTLQQVIDGLNLPTGQYTLSWEGTAQGRIDGGAYGASGAVTVTLAGGVNSTVEFNTGTLANVQLEAGTVATPFENRLYGVELALCQRYAISKNVLYGYDTDHSPGISVWYTDHYPTMRVPPSANILFNASTGINSIASQSSKPSCTLWQFYVDAVGPAVRVLDLAVVYDAEL